MSAATGSTYGGQVFTICGTNFTDVSNISFGTVSTAAYTVTSPTSIRVTAPAVAVGIYDVKVTTPAGTSAVSTADKFTCTVSTPTFTGLSTASGFTSGGDSVIVYGSDLSQATGVFFGNTAAASFTVHADGSLTAVAPAGAAGSVNVTVVTPGGTSPTSAATQFTLTPAGSLPTVTTLGSATGLTTGGQVITITGTNFTDVTSVKFGTVSVGPGATGFTVVSLTSLTVVTPAEAAGTVHVAVVTTAGTSAASSADQFTFRLPTPIVTALSQGSGFGAPSGSGGDRIVISGINLAGATAVFFGTTAAASFAFNSNGTITAITPAWGTPPTSPVDVTVVTPSGTSMSRSLVNRFVLDLAGYERGLSQTGGQKLGG